MFPLFFLLFFLAALVIGIAAPLGKRRRLRQLERIGVEAEARVLDVRSRQFRSRKPRVYVQLKVCPDAGRNFVVLLCAEREWAASGALRSGSIIRVRFNPENHRQMVVLPT